MMFVGIDPGANGGIATIEAESGVIDTYKMPETEADCAELFNQLGRGACFALLEKSQASPVMSPARAFNYGNGFGLLRGCLACNKLIKWDFVKPQVWQKTLQCLSGGDKNVTKAAAQRMFPLLKITHSNADALLIAEYARRLWQTRNPVQR